MPTKPLTTLPLYTLHLHESLPSSSSASTYYPTYVPTLTQREFFLNKYTAIERFLCILLGWKSTYHTGLLNGLGNNDDVPDRLKEFYAELSRMGSLVGEWTVDEEGLPRCRLGGFRGDEVTALEIQMGKKPATLSVERGAYEVVLQEELGESPGLFAVVPPGAEAEGWKNPLCQVKDWDGSFDVLRPFMPERMEEDTMNGKQVLHKRSLEEFDYDIETSEANKRLKQWRNSYGLGVDDEDRMET